MNLGHNYLMKHDLPTAIKYYKEAMIQMKGDLKVFSTYWHQDQMELERKGAGEIQAYIYDLVLLDN